jgi:hypothetical protein
MVLVAARLPHTSSAVVFERLVIAIAYNPARGLERVNVENALLSHRHTKLPYPWLRNLPIVRDSPISSPIGIDVGIFTVVIGSEREITSLQCDHE